jgi:hypothetical protein
MTSLLDRSEQILGVGPWGDYAYEAEIYRTPKGALKVHGPDGWITKGNWDREMNLGAWFICIVGNQGIAELAYRNKPIGSYEELATGLKEDFPELYAEAVTFITNHTGDPETGIAFEPEILTELRAAFL